MTTHTIRTSGARRAACLLAVPALAALAFGTGACSADDAASAAEETVAESVTLAAGSEDAPIAQGADPGSEEHTATGAGVDVSVRGYVKPGQPLEVTADCGNPIDATFDTTFGPSGPLHPAADAGNLHAEFSAPTSIPAPPDGGHTVTVICGDGATATVVMPESGNVGQ